MPEARVRASREVSYEFAMQLASTGALVVVNSYRGIITLGVRSSNKRKRYHLSLTKEDVNQILPKFSRMVVHLVSATPDKVVDSAWVDHPIGGCRLIVGSIEGAKDAGYLLLSDYVSPPVKAIMTLEEVATLHHMLKLALKSIEESEKGKDMDFYEHYQTL